MRSTPIKGDDELLVKSGFKIFNGRGIVAADGGSSGNTSVCARNLIELVRKERASKKPVVEVIYKSESSS